MRISDWSSDVCSSDLGQHSPSLSWRGLFDLLSDRGKSDHHPPARKCGRKHDCLLAGLFGQMKQVNEAPDDGLVTIEFQPCFGECSRRHFAIDHRGNRHCGRRSEEHTSELQSLMRISYAVFCLK